MHPRNLVRMLAVAGAAIAFLSTTAAGGIRAPRTVDLSTRTAVAKYLRSLGIDPKGVVIQRGRRNYAGPQCPGKNWRCTKVRRVVQIATAGSTGRSLQAATPKTGNVAKCSKTEGSSESCTIVQVASGSVSNSAFVDETISQSTGQVQSASQDVKVTQTSQNGSNDSRISQKVTQSETNSALTVAQSETADLTYSVQQTSMTGANTSRVEQFLSQSESAPNGTGGTQYENGNLTGHVAQSSSGLSSSYNKQTHNEAQSAPTGSNVEQTAIDPIKCCTNQSGNPNDFLKLSMNGSQQTVGDNDPDLSAVYSAQCGSSGNCKVSGTQNTNGSASTFSSSGNQVNTGQTCGASSCTPGPPPPPGDVFVSVSDGKVMEFKPDGTPVRTLDTGLGGFTTGLDFSGGKLYVTGFSGNTVTAFAADGTNLGTFGSGYDSAPESIAFDGAGNAYVGQADGTHQLLKFDSAGNPAGSFSPAVEDRGTDWIELGPDDCTIYYTSEGTSVKRFDACANAQLPDLATGLPGPGFALKLLPTGGVLVADSGLVVRLDASGNVVQTYDTQADDSWFALALDPNGTSFWAADPNNSDLVEFNISTGAVERSFNTGTASATVFGLAVAP